MTYYWIGCSGWQYADWREKFYPKEYSYARWFEYYAQQFNTVEINYTFYHTPSIQTLEKWRMQAPANFRYSLKVNRVITHYKKFKSITSILHKFYSLAERLEDKLGCLLFQLPPTMAYQEETLERILKQLDLSKRNVLEFRHASWWCDEVYKILKQAGVSFCSINAPDLPDNLLYTKNEFYLRLHGKGNWYSGNYTARELTAVAESVQHHRPHEAWIYFNNDINGYAPKNALSLAKICKLD